MKLQPPKIVSIRWWKDGEILEEGNELTILETELGGGGGFYWTLRKNCILSTYYWSM